MLTGLTINGMSALLAAQETTDNMNDKPALSALPLRGEVKAEHTWDLSSLFKNDDEWKTALEKLRTKLPEFKTFEGKLTAAGSVLDYLQLSDTVGVEAERIFVYAYLRSSENLADPAAQELTGLAEAFSLKYRETKSFFEPEILALSETQWNEITRDERLRLYRMKLRRIALQRPHTLSRSEERLLAMMSNISRTPSKAFNLFNNTDLKFGTVKDDTGKDVPLSTGSFIVLMNSPDRNVRRTAFEQFYEGYKSHENSLSALLAGSIQKDVFYAKVRNFPSALEAALFYEEVPRTVYDNLITAVNKALPVLHRYYEIRRKKMNLDTIHMYDIYIPILSELKTNYTWEQAVDTICNAVSILGKEYTETLRAGLTTQRWCDRYENQGKRSGAFSYGSFSAKPYILMNYKDNVIDGMFTLAHEGGHSMHSYYSARSQPFVYYDYVTFVAEVASTTNEDLLSRHLLKEAQDKQMRAYLVNRQIDSIRNTLFRQTMFAEFEQKTHAAAEREEALTAKSLQGMYHDLLKQYFGPKFAVDDILAAECLRVPHFYRNFYVYKYATGLSAALALSKQISESASQTDGDNERAEGDNPPKTVQDYLQFLSGGSSARPLELLRTAGVDMESPAPIEAAMQRFEELVNELENLLF